MYERQALRASTGAGVLGRAARWASSTAGAGWSTSRRRRRRGAGIEVRHDAPVVARWRPAAASVARRRARRCARRRWCWPRAASSPTRRCARPTSGPNWDVAKVRGTPYNTGEVLRAALELGAAPYGHWSGCHAIQWDRDAPPIRRPGAHQPLLPPVLSGRDRRQRATASASSTRARTSATTPTPSTARRCCASPPGWRSSSSTSGRCGLLRDDRLRGAGRDARRGGHARRAGRGARHRPERLERDRRASTTRRSSAADVRPGGQGRPAHRGPRRAQVQLGAAAGLAAVRRVPGHLRDHVHVRRAARGRGRARAGPRAAARSRACTRPASSSAGCSSTTTRAAPA